MKRVGYWIFLSLSLPLVVPTAVSQTANLLSHTVIVANPPDSIHFEKCYR